MINDAQKWGKGLEKTRKGFWGRLTHLFKTKPGLDPVLFDELEEILIESDIGTEVVFKLIEEVKSDIRKKGDGTSENVQVLLKEKMTRMLGDVPFSPLKHKPHVILVAGVNGTGKTTFIGKLAWRYRQEGKKVLLAAADTFRAAANEQLDIWAKRAGADVIKQPPGSDPAAVAFDALDAALARGVDVLIVDTAGRLHTKINLMEELKKIRRILSKKMSDAPHEVLLVLDAVTGQNGLRQARLFQEAGSMTGIVLAKLDGTAKGGIVIAIRQALGIPVKWVCVGEGLEDLIPFDPKAFVEGMFG